MRDPERLLSVTSDADPMEREVLAQLQRATAPTSAKRAAWEGIAAGIAVSAVSATASGTAASAAASATTTAGAKAALGAKLVLGATTKVALAAALGAAAVGGAYVAYRSAAPVRHQERAPVHVVAPVRTTPPITTHVAAQEAARPQATPIQPSAPSAARATNKATKPSDLLAEESALLGTARAQLRNGDAIAAEATIDRLRQRFPKGALLQEREVLRIDMLEARGAHGAAMRSARAFVRRYPNSPHSTKLRLFLTTP